MSGEILSLVFGFIIISLFLSSIEVLNKRQFEQKKMSIHPNKTDEKTK
jgi:hypothetical protein